MGVKALKLRDDDELATARVVAPDKDHVLVLTAAGYGKRVDVPVSAQNNFTRRSLVDLRTGDELLWTQIPPGAKRDLTRFARDGVEDLARNRLQTMREVVAFVDAADDAPWEKGPWGTAVITWEADQAHQEAQAKALSLIHT